MRSRDNWSLAETSLRGGTYKDNEANGSTVPGVETDASAFKLLPPKFTLRAQWQEKPKIDQDDCESIIVHTEYEKTEDGQKQV